MPTEKLRSDCPINYALEIFGDKWSLLIIRDIMYKDKHYFTEFVKSEEKIATNILASRLALLEEKDIISKTADEKNGSKIRYELTPKGKDLMSVMVEIMVWSAQYQNSKKSSAAA